MKKDTQKGHGNWVGCHAFESIVFDGFPSQGLRRRKNGLKMGDTYYYFYKIDCGIDYCDHTAPTTSTCPLLPGQPVNILEVPVELPDFSDSALNNRSQGHHTLNPKDRYKSLRGSSRRKPSDPVVLPHISTCQRQTEDQRKRSFSKAQGPALTSSFQGLPGLKKSSTTNIQKATSHGGHNRVLDNISLPKAPALERPHPQVAVQDRPLTRKGEPLTKNGHNKAAFPQLAEYVKSKPAKHITGHDNSEKPHSKNIPNRVSSLHAKIFPAKQSSRTKSSRQPYRTNPPPALYIPRATHDLINTTPKTTNPNDAPTFITPPPYLSASDSPDPTPRSLTTPRLRREPRKLRESEQFGDPLHRHAVDQHALFASPAFVTDGYAYECGMNEDGELMMSDGAEMFTKQQQGELYQAENRAFYATAGNPFLDETAMGGGGGQRVLGLGISGLEDRGEFWRELGYLGQVIV